IDLDYAVQEGQTGDDMASALFVFGLKDKPEVTRNGKACSELMPVVQVDMQVAYVVPLFDSAPYRATEAIVERYVRSSRTQLSEMSALTRVEAQMKYEPGQEHYLLTEPRSGAI